ncbi:MAG: c-type cytochrome [Planctomycetales bacterium]|nr:c-type cytochrome [Planctomycetales bacterium]
MLLRFALFISFSVLLIDVAVAANNAAVTVQLGSDDLTAGIPGKGDLTIKQIKSWLENEENHKPLSPELPFGLSAAQSSIKGIDANPMTRAKIELGRQLYFDTRLSSDNTISCASCHHPNEGFARHTQFGIGVDGQMGGRNSPVSYNRIVSGPQFWDGRAESLEAQAVGPIANPIEMANTHENAVKTLAGIEGYKVQFERIFDTGVNIDNVGKAIATFERAIVSGPAPFDYFERMRAIKNQFGGDDFDEEELKEEEPELHADYVEAVAKSKPMSESARRGRDLFFSDNVGCTACHAGANFTDELYHNLGVAMDAEKPDLGRYEISKQEKDKGAFKTPTVRNVSLSAPYMHDGSQKTLKEVVDWYNKGGHPNAHLSDKVKKLNLSEQQVEDIVNFMDEGLTSKFPKIETGRLPQ